jgi:hypothetical protein
VEELQGRWFHFTAHGHVNVTARHRTTIEITTESHLTPRGDCIIGVSSEASASSLPEWLKEGLRDSNSVIVLLLCAGGLCDSVLGRGDPRITADNDVKMIVRRSDYVESSTIMTRSSKAAADLNRELVSRLAKGEQLHVFMTYLKVAQHVTNII